MDYLFQIDFCSSFHEFTVTSDTDFLCDLTATVDVHAKNGRFFGFRLIKVLNWNSCKVDIGYLNQSSASFESEAQHKNLNTGSFAPAFSQFPN